MQQLVTSSDIYGNKYEVPVGHLSWRPAAYAILVRNDNILLVKERNLYHMPGGGVDLGETPDDGVIREVKEETGLDAANPRLVGSLSTFFTLAHKRNLDEPSHVQSLLLYYLCDVRDGEISVDGLEDDEKDYGLIPEWVALDGLDSLQLGSTVDWRPIVKRALKIS